MTYHQLQLTLHSDHALVQHECITLASFLNIPWRALRNQLGEWGNPKRMRYTTTAASKVKLPDPCYSHHVGVYVLNGAVFSPDSLKRPLETCPRAQFLHDRLVPPDDFQPSRYHMDAVTSAAVEGIDGMVAASNKALIKRGYSPRFITLSMHFLPELSLVVYTADAVVQHIHNGYGRRGRFPGIDLPVTGPVAVKPFRRRIIPAGETFPVYLNTA